MTENNEWLKVTNKKDCRDNRDSRKTILTPLIHVNTIYNGYRHWVRFYRGPIYKLSSDNNGEDIYHWHLESHNFFPIEDNRKNSKTTRIYLAFTQPDYQVIQMDKKPRYAFDMKQEEPLIVPILNFARWKEIKFKPNSFIARNADQIVEALKHVKYCMIEYFIEDFSGSTPNDGISESTTAISGVNSNIIPIIAAVRSQDNATQPIKIPQSSGNSVSAPYQLEISKDDDEEDKEYRSIRLVYPNYPATRSILEDMQTDQRNVKLDLMAESPLGCLQSPN